MCWHKWEYINKQTLLQLRDNPPYHLVVLSDKGKLFGNVINYENFSEYVIVGKTRICKKCYIKQNLWIGRNSYYGYNFIRWYSKKVFGIKIYLPELNFSWTKHIYDTNLTISESRNKKLSKIIN